MGATATMTDEVGNPISATLEFIDANTVSVRASLGSQKAYTSRLTITNPDKQCALAKRGAQTQLCSLALPNNLRSFLSHRRQCYSLCVSQGTAPPADGSLARLIRIVDLSGAPIVQYCHSSTSK